MSKQKLHNIKDDNEDAISLTPEEYIALKEKTEDTFINFQRLLNRNKPHIKKYHEARKLHNEILDTMETYFEQNTEECNVIMNELLNGKYNVSFDLAQDIDRRVFLDILIHPFHDNCLCDTLIRKRKIRSARKCGMIQAMKESCIGIYKVIDVDIVDCTVTLKNINTKKTVTIIDERMSSLNRDLDKSLFFFRIITWEGVSFQSGTFLMYAKGDYNLRKLINHPDFCALPLRQLISVYNLFHRNNDPQSDAPKYRIRIK